MVLAGGALLVLAALLRKKPRYSFATQLWCATALAVGWGVMLFKPPEGLGLDTRQWAWALGAAALAIPLARLLWPKAISLAAALGMGAALLAGASQLWPAWFAQAWPMAAAAVALAFAAAALQLDRASDEQLFFLARAPLADALRAASALLAAAGGALALVSSTGAALRLTSALPVSLGVPLALTLLLAAGAAFLVARRALPALGVPILVGLAALAVCSVAAPLLAPWAGPVAPVVVLSALSLIAHALRRFEPLRRHLSQASAALWVAALVSSHARPGEWTTGVALALGAVVLRGAPLPGLAGALAVPTFLLLGGAGFLLAWGTTRVPLLAAIGVAAGLGLCTALAAGLHEVLAARGRGARADANALGLIAAGLIAWAALAEPLPARAACIAAGALLVAALLAARSIGRAGDLIAPAGLELAALVLGALYFYGRARLGLFAGVPRIDRNVILGAALLLVPLERALAPRRDDLARSLARTSSLLPVALAPIALSSDLPTSAAGAAMLYGLLAWLHRSRGAAFAGLLLANIFFIATFRERGAQDAQLYTIPLGVSLLLAAQLSRPDLKRAQLSWLRGFGCVVLYAGTAWQMLGDDALLFPLLLGGMALVTIALGVVLQVRAFVWLGATSLAVTVLANLVRYSARSSMVLTISVTLTGLAIMAGMAFFSVRREQALQLYRRLVRGMDGWE
jgi:hypothetical protein